MPRHNAPNGRFGQTSEPPVFMRMGRRFPIEAQPEIASRSEGSFRDTVSASASIGKAHPVLDIDNGMRFSFRRSRETTSRNPGSDRDTVSRWGGFRKACPALRAHSGMDFPKQRPLGSCGPFWASILGRTFRYGGVAEIVSRSEDAIWDAVSGTAPLGKLRPIPAL